MSRWDAGVRYRTHPLLRANVVNVFGRDYWATAYEGWMLPGAARTVMLSATMDF